MFYSSNLFDVCVCVWWVLFVYLSIQPGAVLFFKRLDQCSWFIQNRIEVDGWSLTITSGNFQHLDTTFLWKKSFPDRSGGHRIKAGCLHDTVFFWTPLKVVGGFCFSTFVIFFFFFFWFHNSIRNWMYEDLFLYTCQEREREKNFSPISCKPLIW